MAEGIYRTMDQEGNEISVICIKNDLEAAKLRWNRFDRFGNNKRKGAFLAGSLLWCLSALSFAFLTHQTAYGIFEIFRWRTYLLKRDNVSAEASAFVKEWFVNSAEKGHIAAPSDFQPDSAPFDDPYVSLPDGLLSDINKLNPDFSIEAAVIDRHYSDAFKEEAELIGIPKSLPSLVEIEYSDASPDIYGVKRYSMIVRVNSAKKDIMPLVTDTDIYLVIDSGNNIRAVTLYTKKH